MPKLLVSLIILISTGCVTKVITKKCVETKDGSFWVCDRVR